MTLAYFLLKCILTFKLYNMEYIIFLLIIISTSNLIISISSHIKIDRFYLKKLYQKNNRLSIKKGTIETTKPPIRHCGGSTKTN